MLVGCEAFRPTVLQSSVAKTKDYEVMMSRFEGDTISMSRFCSVVEIFSNCNTCNVKTNSPIITKVLYGNQRLDSYVKHRSSYDSSLTDRSLKVDKYEICFNKPDIGNRYNYNLDLNGMMYIDLLNRRDTIYINKKFELRILE